MKSSEFCNILINIADNYKTLYVMGCIGAPITSATVNRYLSNNPYNKQPDRTAMIKAAVDKTPVVFGFDCVCLIKSVLWGWSGDKTKPYGGAVYGSNGVPDIGADQMIQVCSDVSTDFTSILPGEAVWLPGHIGVYIGEGKVIECTPKWDNGVQYSACLNIGQIPGMNGRSWSRHGKLPYIENESEEDNVKAIKIIANMNGKETELTSIVYNDENYIKIRDLANAQSDDKLTVDYDETSNTVIINSK